MELSKTTAVANPEVTTYRPSLPVLQLQRWRWPGTCRASTYHDLRLKCDAATDGLSERRNCQPAANFLTERHQHGIHELLHKPSLA